TGFVSLMSNGMDVFFSEKTLYGAGRIEAAIEDLRSKGLIYDGFLEPPEGGSPEDWEPREQTFFRSTDFGDDADRPIKNADNTWTYFAPDIAYHFDKISRGFDALVNVFGADYGSYVKRMKAVVSALSDNHMPFDIKLTKPVRFFEHGEPYKMSKRPGAFNTLRNLVDRIGPDVTRFAMLTRRNDAALDVDLAELLDQSKDNPVFNVQYAHAQVQSVLRKARQAGIPCEDADLAAVDLSGLIHDAELTVAKRLAEWPRMVDIAARTKEPHRIAFYLNDLASEFHALWTKAGDVPELRFVREDDLTVSAAKIALPRAVAVVISAGLGILGVTPADEMR
ncbi:MAG: DALR anticodon-binding domain-containing protein, partial [Pseudomonadota bacterium]